MASMEEYPVFILSLADMIDRREKIRDQMEVLGIDFTFVDAVDGRNGIPEKYEKFIDREAAARNHGRVLSDAELACALSHALLYRRVMDSALAGAVILEDDAIMTREFGRFILEKDYRRCGMILLGHEGGRVYPGKDISLFDGYRLMPLAWPAMLTVGYSISREMAGELCRKSLPVSRVADWGADIATLGAYAMVPPAIGHPPVESNDSVIQVQRTVSKRQARAGNKGKFFRSPPSLFTQKYWKRLWLKSASRPVDGSYSISSKGLL